MIIINHDNKLSTLRPNFIAKANPVLPQFNYLRNINQFEYMFKVHDLSLLPPRIERIEWAQ